MSLLLTAAVAIGLTGGLAAERSGRTWRRLVGQPADIASSALSISGGSQGGRESAGELAGADVVRRATAEQARRCAGGGDPAGVVRIALGRDPPGEDAGTDLGGRRQATARSRGIDDHDLERPMQRQFVVEQPGRR